MDIIYKKYPEKKIEKEKRDAEKKKLEEEADKKKKEREQEEILSQYNPFGNQPQMNNADDDPDNKGDSINGNQGGDVDEK